MTRWQQTKVAYKALDRIMHLDGRYRREAHLRSDQKAQGFA